MKATFLGHAGFLVETSRHRVLIDPFLSGNPVAAIKASDVRPDAILLTHGHSDHLGDAVEIAKASGALVVSVHELSVWLKKRGVKTHAMHIGGSHTFDFGAVKFTPALHGTGIDDGDDLVYGGVAAGILFTADEKVFYHSGDTGLFSDMKLIGDRHRIDVAVLPIGDNFTMGPDDAALAASWIHPKLAIPMHYNTFPLINQDGAAFVKQIAALGVAGKVLQPGESVEF